MRVLVTGAAGFIGSHVTRRLLAEGHHVVGIDDLSSGRRRNLPSSPQFSLIEGDIRDPEACARAMRGVDGVVHLAARNSVPRSLAEPERTLDVNVRGGTTLLNAARDQRVARFVYASSSSVYGDDPALPKCESQRLRPLSPYAASKAAFEQLACAWTASYGLPTLGLRFFNVFGPRQLQDGAYAAVVPRFVRAALTGRPPTIHGDGSFSRDFTYVDNVTGAVTRALQAPEGAAGRVVNVACGRRVSVLDLWHAIARAAGSMVQPRFGPARRGDMPHSLASLQQARRWLGYEPLVSLEDGVRETVAWYAAQGDALEG